MTPAPDDLEPRGLQLELEDALPLEERAIRLVVGTQFGSAGQLQRQLGISRARAADLMATLEEHGIVGPQPAPGRTRDVLIRAELVDQAIASVTPSPQHPTPGDDR